MTEPTEPRPRPERARAEGLAVLVPAALLVAVATHQVFLHATASLAPWKGGGFGMFSSNDGVWARHAHVYVVAGDERERVEVPRSLDDEEDRLLALPTHARLEAFARRLSEAVRDEHPDHAAIAIEVYRTDFDPDDLTPRLELLRVGQFPIGGDD